MGADASVVGRSAQSCSKIAAVVGSSSGRAFRWTEKTGIIALPGDPVQSVQARAISADGKIIYGVEGEKNGHLHVVRWDSDGNVTRYTNSPDVRISQVYGTSADGSVAVGSQLTNKGLRAVAWHSATDVRQLGLLHNGDSSEAEAVNADGTAVVGQATDGADQNKTVVFRWTPSTGMHSLSEWISEAGGDPGPLGANIGSGISADGSAVVGALRNTDPFIAIVPGHRR